MTTHDQVTGAVHACGALAEAIRTLGRIPSGHLYAQVMGAMTFESFTCAIGTLKRAGLVREVAHELTWIGPVVPATALAT